MGKVTERVEKLLVHLPRTRNSDKELLLEYWERQGLVLSQSQRLTFLNLCTPAESITRARRLLREKYPGTPEVEQERRAKEDQLTQSKGDV